MPTQLCNYDLREVATIQQDIKDWEAQKPRPSNYEQHLHDLNTELTQATANLNTCQLDAVQTSLSSGTWGMNGNGFSLSLVIRYVESSGTVVGWIEDSTQTTVLEQATWDQANGHLHFVRVLPNGENQTYDGYLFDDPTGVAADTIAGIFSADRFEARPTFGWYASISLFG